MSNSLGLVDILFAQLCISHCTDCAWSFAIVPRRSIDLDISLALALLLIVLLLGQWLMQGPKTFGITKRIRCGWGSGALYYAEVLPNSKVTAFSNSRTQKIYIDQKAKEKGLKNLTVITGNVVDYEFEKESFDRVVSIEVCHRLHAWKI